MSPRPRKDGSETVTDIRLAARRRRVMLLLTRGYTTSEMAEMLEVTDHVIRRDVRAIRSAFQADMGESSSVMAVAEGVIRRTRARERALWALYDRAVATRAKILGPDGRETEVNVDDDKLAAISALRELRESMSAEVKTLQALGLVYKAPERMALDMRVMAMLGGLAPADIEKLASAGDADFVKLLEGIVGSDSAAEMIGAGPPVQGAPVRRGTLQKVARAG